MTSELSNALNPNVVQSRSRSRNPYSSPPFNFEYAAPQQAQPVVPYVPHRSELELAIAEPLHYQSVLNAFSRLSYHSDSAQDLHRPHLHRIKTLLRSRRYFAFYRQAERMLKRKENVVRHGRRSRRRSMRVRRMICNSSCSI